MPERARQRVQRWAGRRVVSAEGMGGGSKLLSNRQTLRQSQDHSR